MITANPAYTSQTCNVCTVVDRKSRESQAAFRCTSCGHTEHADVNAAKNILAAGRAEHAQPRPGVRAGARKPRNRVGRKANRQAREPSSRAPIRAAVLPQVQMRARTHLQMQAQTLVVARERVTAWAQEGLTGWRRKPAMGRFFCGLGPRPSRQRHDTATRSPVAGPPRNRPGPTRPGPTVRSACLRRPGGPPA
ncbi:zinc ribbon domain-containing protein [Nonomuraea aurantiaca]|uniref:zinc ribbon domain-containing protein n=1 Tax=Nonomuraea aurantiaca TaxID=2878562 RepID=UPI0027E187A4|nr:zinc ribbon domain-containing protein [Nonomuraea aurantiaca]